MKSTAWPFCGLCGDYTKTLPPPGVRFQGETAVRRPDEMDDPIKSLTELGFTEDEAKAYCVLLEDSPLSGYAVAQRADIFRAHIYEVLSSLYRKGCITISYSSASEYAAIPYQQMLANVSRASEENRREAVRQAADFTKEGRRDDIIWNLYSSRDIYSTLSRLIADTGDYILMKLWARDLSVIKDSLADAAARGVALHLVVLGSFQTSAFPFFCYPACSEEEDGTPYRKISAAFGNREVLCGTLSDTRQSFCAHTRNYCLRVPVYSQLLYDLDIAELYRRDTDGHLTEAYGGDLIKLRRKYL
jgi:sugar-specific transcriptional regulator TrmB